MQCPQCQTRVAPGKAFCTKCGTALAAQTSLLTVDRDTLNNLLQGMQLSPEGKLMAGPVEIDPVRLLKPELTLRWGGYVVSVEQLTLGADGLRVSLDLK